MVDLKLLPAVYQHEHEDMTFDVFSHTWNKIVEIPTEWEDLFPSSSQYFLCNFKEDFWSALMCQLESDFLFSTPLTQSSCILRFKSKLIESVHDLFSEKRYVSYGYNKHAMYSFLQTDDVFNDSLGHLVSDYLQVNIVIFTDIAERYYYTFSPWDPTLPSYIMLHHGIDWGCISHAIKEKRLFTTEEAAIFLEKCKKHHQPTDSSSGDINVSDLKKKIKNMKIKELQEKALDLQISIDDDNGKKKLKSILQRDIYYAMSGLMWSS